ncbi:hypothetical protein SAMN05444008_11871 [Cnuella takakiae]|uniref:Uncharacterized protein n=1 Tax=Cnuella takakiae TaxID=1302690 RepID=A0A1M5H823_9BACT|nr:hypothetical protein SAMN05444008_11871 [Cnuella takakiae]
MAALMKPFVKSCLTDFGTTILFIRNATKTNFIKTKSAQRQSLAAILLTFQFTRLFII